jgi:general L-amino acid transport system permease protein
VQLVFWYRGVILQLPGLESAYALGRSGDEALALLSVRGLALVRPGGGSALALVLAALAGVALAGATVVWRDRVERRTGRPGRAWLWAAVAFAIPLALAWIGGSSGALDMPSAGRFRYGGGFVLTPEYLALLVGLVTYTAAFIAEVLRSGIQSVGDGQRDAGLAVGLREAQLLRRIILPQALRVAIPPLTSQYLNLTKNSSLAIAVGYPDLFNVGQTVANQTGQAVMVILLVMAVYLSISLTTSALMNLYARRVRLVER